MHVNEVVHPSIQENHHEIQYFFTLKPNTAFIILLETQPLLLIVAITTYH